jgi:hypothetical protein
LFWCFQASGTIRAPLAPRTSEHTPSRRQGSSSTCARLEEEEEEEEEEKEKEKEEETQEEEEE